MPVLRSYLLIFCFLLSNSAISAPAESLEDRKALDLFEHIFNQWLERSPVWQSELGIKTQNDKWDDISESADVAGQKQRMQQLRSLSAINTAKLSSKVLISYQLMKQQLQTDIDMYQWHLYDYPVNQMFGWHTTVPSTLINIHLIETEQDAKDYIRRVNRVPRLIDQLIDGLKLRATAGIIAPKFVFPKVIDDCQNLLKGAPFDKGAPSPLLADFEAKLAKITLTKKVKTKLIKQLNKGLTRKLAPAYRKLIGYLATLEKQADDRAGAWKFPKGTEFYNAALRKTTTTDLSADDIHQLGLQEVSRIHQEMKKIMAQVGFKGDLAAFFQYLKTDPKFYYPDTEEGKSQYLALTRTKIAEITRRLPELFNTIPKAPLKVKAVEAFREKSTGKAFYQPPPASGNRPGIYYANLYNMREMPKYQMDALLYHEALPGHHLQLGIATELGDMPKFRKFGGYTAYIEGWGLYAELLPKEIGLYQDPYADFGRLDLELWRACRLVVDTGIHAKKWTRKQAIDYLMQNTPSVASSARRAIERYIVMPSQATAYKVGMLKILELRDTLKQRQKDRFDIRKFHDLILNSGALPLNLLEQQVLGKPEFLH